MAAKCRKKGWSRHPEPDALEHEGLWSEPDRSTGCEVMRSPGPHGKDGLTLWIQAASRKRRKRTVQMTPLCKVEMTLPRIRASQEMHRGSGVDEAR